jgi:hypothetical protein
MPKQSTEIYSEPERIAPGCVAPHWANMLSALGVGHV